MPSTIGLGQARQAALGGTQLFPGRLEVSGDGDLTLPADLLAQAGLDAGDDLICEAGPDGLRLTSNTLRKAYVEVTSACNLPVRHTSATRGPSRSGTCRWRASPGCWTACRATRWPCR